MTCQRTAAVIGVFAILSLAAPAPLDSAPVHIPTPARPNDDLATVVVVRMSTFFSSGKECNVWRLNFVGPNVTPECRQWATDVDYSTADRQTIDIQTVKLASENAVCKQWHVESHENLVRPVCGEIHNEAGFGVHDPAGQPQKRDETLPEAVEDVVEAGKHLAGEVIDVAVAGLDTLIDLIHAIVAKHDDKSKRSDEDSTSKNLADDMPPLPSLEEVQRIVANIKEKQPGLVHFVTRCADSEILMHKLREHDTKTATRLEGLAAWLQDPESAMRVAQIARENDLEVLTDVTEPSLSTLMRLARDGDKPASRELASVQAAEKVVSKAEMKANSAPEIIKRGLVEPLQPLPALDEMQTMIDTVRELAPGAALLISRIGASPIFSNITMGPNAQTIRDIATIGHLFADPAAWLENAQQARAALASKKIAVDQLPFPAAAAVRHAVRNLTDASVPMETRPYFRVLTNATLADELISQAEDQAAAFLARGEKLQRRLLPFAWALAILVPIAAISSGMGGLRH